MPLYLAHSFLAIKSAHSALPYATGLKHTRPIVNHLPCTRKTRLSLYIARSRPASFIRSNATRRRPLCSPLLLHLHGLPAHGPCAVRARMHACTGRTAARVGCAWVAKNNKSAEGPMLRPRGVFRLSPLHHARTWFTRPGRVCTPRYDGSYRVTP